MLYFGGSPTQFDHDLVAGDETGMVVAYRRTADEPWQVYADQTVNTGITTNGMDRVAHRAFMRATGMDDEAISKPFIGVMSTHGENTPCSMSLRPQADAAKMGVAAAGGTPIEFTTVSVSDGTSMNHKGMRMSLLSRELDRKSVV